VGTPAAYEGLNVGVTVGELVGETEGTGVGLPTVTVTDTPVAVVVAADESVTFFEDLYTAVTVVPLLIPVAETVAPVAMEEASDTVMFVEPLTNDAVTVDATCVYVGESVGEAVGALLGETVGAGVGLPDLYVGVRVGQAVGSTVGEAEGCGEGTATTVNVKYTPVVLVAVMVLLSVMVPDP